MNKMADMYKTILFTALGAGVGAVINWVVVKTTSQTNDVNLWPGIILGGGAGFIMSNPIYVSKISKEAESLGKSLKRMK